METFSALLALCVGNSPVNGEFPTQRPVKWSFDAFFDLRLNKRLSKLSKRRWFETPSRSWRQCYVEMITKLLSGGRFLSIQIVHLSSYLIDDNGLKSLYPSAIVVAVDFKTNNPSLIILWLEEAYMRQWTGPTLVQTMTCRLFGAKP